MKLDPPPPPRIELSGYAAEEVFSSVEIDLLGWAEHFVAKVPPRQPDGQRTRCHEIARAVGRLIEQPVVDGTYGMSAQHSWIELEVKDWREGRKLDGSPPIRRKHILDVYAIGRVPRVQLIDAFFMLPEFKSYKAGAKRQDVREDIVAWLILKIQQ